MFWKHNAQILFEDHSKSWWSDGSESPSEWEVLWRAVNERQFLQKLDSNGKGNIEGISF